MFLLVFILPFKINICFLSSKKIKVGKSLMHGPFPEVLWYKFQICRLGVP
jgi:hypothetical protein